ncbi:phosphomannomutase [Synechococcus sp. PCC 7502]|uniref:phosphoglucomutase/phosphomannomutase family protein n=1 Tax=Synechococcus sp. PCC 7502 TaxID=1173263 RepID=UPI00029FF737|nr:phosphoglucomutase/phosphomannomutase family protein [Synechococcus sp. PCC 7502]AFY72787.1 phosphomannomutase [Synechococcus sp. PCC 7502]
MSTHAEPPIRFGTDGWRGLIADEFTFKRLGTVAPLAAQALADSFGNYFHSNHPSKTIIIGYDRRFLSPEFAQYIAKKVAAVGFDVQLSQGFAPTPAFSWAAFSQKALGALVITASHNPAGYSGLKIKGAFGGSVSPDLTKQVERKLDAGLTLPQVNTGKITVFDPWESYCQVLRSLVDIQAIQNLISSGELTVFADPMYGAAAGGLAKILELPIREINSKSDPTFGGSAPEPLPRYLSALFRKVRSFHFANPDQSSPKLSVGFVFDGDGDRIAAVDSTGNFLSSQILIPILIDHLAKRRGFTGEVIKTISGLNLIPKVAALHNLPVFETPIGYKYIAERMLSGIAKPLLGGEESGGIGYGTHIPERDALLSALYLLEAIAISKQDLSTIYDNLQTQTGYKSYYDRIDKHLASSEDSKKVLQILQTEPFIEINGRKVISINTVDGFKFELEDASWLLIRFSGTEPVLRLYCEAATPELVKQTLGWISDWVKVVV